MKTIFEEKSISGFVDLCIQNGLKINKQDSIQYLERIIRYYKGNLEERENLRQMQDIENRWYKSLSLGSPDYSVYQESLMILEVFSCWFVYSSKTLKEFKKHLWFEQIKMRVKSVADLGCGCGFTTSALKEFFPFASVCGTQLEGVQLKIASAIGKARRFSVKSNDDLTQSDLIFASEYFEHFQEPVEHLKFIIEKTNPKFLVLANAFGAKSVGHFDEYIVYRCAISNKKVGRVFNSYLRSQGFQIVKPLCWNGRPALWEKVV